MTAPFFFGYGSLVNRRTHDYPRVHAASVRGWRRRWMHASTRPLAYLTAYEAPGGRIDGVIAEVPGGDWSALDVRERAYGRHEVPESHRDHDGIRPATVEIYAVPPSSAAGAETRHPILLSYIDVVIQGFMAEFGEDGAANFFATTDGWDAPVLNDRAAPIYRRHQRLSPSETAFVDAALSSLSVTMKELE
ncbi:MAG: gamma-glutamylcyclotransferase family protein [Pseudomonadota bacterium]